MEYNRNTVILLHLRSEGEEEEARKTPVLQRSAKLREYGILVRYVKEGLAAGKDRKEAVDTAIERCLKENILADFLRTHSAEVEKMAWQSITMEEFIEIRAEEAAEIAAEKATAETTERVTREVTEEVTKEVTKKTLERTTLSNIQSLMKNLHLSIEQAMNSLDIPEADQQHYQNLIQIAEN